MNETEDGLPRRRWCARMLSCDAEELREEGFAAAEVTRDALRLAAFIEGRKP